MKKVLALLLSAALMISALSMLSGCSGDKGVPKTGEVLYVYNWGEYISNGDDGTLDTNKQFEKETGIEVKYLNFSSNEEMYTKIKSGSMTVDVIIPSDYMIAQMIREGMLKKLNFDNIPNFENIDEKFRKVEFDPTGEYSIPYTWGCTAIFYDSRYVDPADIDEDSWDLLWNEKYAGKTLMFNNQRDAFGVAEARLGYSLNTENQEELEACYQELVKQCAVVQGNYYGDEIFDKLESGEAVVAPYYNGDLLMIQETNEYVKGYIPKGANTFIDSMCIPTCCQNQSAAEKYINFMCRPDVAQANIETIGYASPMSCVVEQLDEEMTGEFFYPSDEKLAECEVFRALPEETNAFLSAKWEDLMNQSRG